MAILNEKILQELGIELDPDTKQQLAEHFETTLNDRVTTEIVEELNPEQLQQLSVMKTKSDEELQAWLAQNVPDLKEIVEDEVAILLGEIAENSDQF